MVLIIKLIHKCNRTFNKFHPGSEIFMAFPLKEELSICAPITGDFIDIKLMIIHKEVGCGCHDDIV